MLEKIKKHWKIILCVLVVVFVVIVGAIYSYKHWYIPYRNLKNGFVVVETFDCPEDHPIKANLRSMIYHLPDGTYYKRTNATNGYCFDNVDHVEQQGFRKPYN